MTWNIFQRIKEALEGLYSICWIDGHAGIYAWHEALLKLGYKDLAEQVHPDNHSWLDNLDWIIDEANFRLNPYWILITQTENGDIFICRQLVECKERPKGTLIADSQEVRAVLEAIGWLDWEEPPNALIVQAENAQYKAVFATWSSRPYDKKAVWEKIV